MLTIKCSVGVWNAKASLEKLGINKRMAIISATAGHGKESIESRHTVVFDHAHGMDDVEEATALIERLLVKSH